MLDFRAVIVACLVTLTALGSEPITELAILRALPSADAAKGLPVRIEGTVVGLEPSAPFHFFLNDGKDGCFIKTHPSGRPPELVPGDHVRVEGISDPLGYYPSVKDGRVTILGKKPLPPPVKPNAGQMFAPERLSGFPVPWQGGGQDEGHRSQLVAVLEQRLDRHGLGADLQLQRGALHE
jgi:hypothetical protein